jgi:hypothetical protein
MSNCKSSWIATTAKFGLRRSEGGRGRVREKQNKLVELY